MAKSSLEERIPDIMDGLMDGSPDIFLGVLVKTINPILTANRYKNLYLVPRNSNAINDKSCECDVLYRVYLHAMKNQSGDHIIKYDLYQEARNKLNAMMFKHYKKQYKTILESNDV